MEIRNEESATKGSFYVELDGQREGSLFYTKAGPGRLIVDHTEVSDKLRGKNVGKQLVAAVVAHARRNNLKIIPLCPFTRSVFERVRDYDDVWEKS